MPKLSVIVPVYNSEKHLEKCLDSIINQEEKDMEVILIDDKSKDKSLDIMEQYERMNNKKIKIVENSQNKGAGYSRNRGIELATGDYIGFIDSDDYIEKDMYSKMIFQAEKNSSDVIITGLDLKYRGVNLSFLGRNIELPIGTFNTKDNKHILVNTRPSCCNKLFKRDLIGENRFPENLKWEDYPFVIYMLALSDKISILGDKDYHYCINPFGTTCGDMKGTISSKMFDIFLASELLENKLKESDLISIFHDELKIIQIVNALARARDLLFKNIPYSKKEELICLIIDTITELYGEWQKNTWYIEQKEKSLFYKARMECVEKIYYSAKQKTKK